MDLEQIGNGMIVVGAIGVVIGVICYHVGAKMKE
jgi:preprotein translocase subunit Sss1